MPVVVDGDGLFALAWDADGAAPVLRRRARRRPCSRRTTASSALLTGAPPGADRIAAARRLAADTGAVVLLKGPATVVADPGGDVLVVAAGDARLATAGTGDVLAGHHRRAAGHRACDAVRRGRAPAPWLHAAAGRLGPPSGSSPATSLDALPGGARGARDEPPPAARWAWAEIDLDAVAHNVGVLRARSSRRRRCGPSSRPTATGTAPSPVAAAALDAGATGSCVALTAEGVGPARGRHRGADPRAQRAAARARADARRPPA